MEHAEKPKRSEHDSRPFLMVAGLVTAILWYSSLSVPSIIWLKPPLNTFTPLFNIACVVVPPLVIVIYLGYHEMKGWQEVLLLVFGLAACAGVCWIIFSMLFESGYDPCERRSGDTVVCLTFDADNAYSYTFYSPDFIPLIMIRTGYIGTAWEENACSLMKMGGCGRVRPRIK